MKLLTKIASIFTFRPQDPFVPAAIAANYPALVSNGTYAGVNVNMPTALGLSAYWACLRLIAGTMSTLPFKSMQDKDGKTVMLPGSQLSRLFYNPNADQTGVDFLDFMFMSLLTGGDAFAWLEMDGERIITMTPLPYDVVVVERKSNGRLRYKWTLDGKSYDVDENKVFHVRGPGGGPMRGLSSLQYGRRALGLAGAADQTSASLFENAARPSGVVSMKEWMTDVQRKRQRDLIQNDYAGTMNAGKPFILEGGMDWQSISINPVDAQLLEQRRFSVEEICRFLGVPPHMIGHTDKQTSWGSGVEQQTLGFQKFTLRQWAKRFEASANKQLLSARQKAEGVYLEFNFEGLLRGDSAARAEFYTKMTQAGVMSINECREKENLPPIEGGDKPRTQMQMIPVDAPYQPPTAAAAPAPGKP